MLLYVVILFVDLYFFIFFFFFFQAEDGIRDKLVTGVQTCALPISRRITCDSQDLEITVTEMRLLEHLMLHAGETVTRSQLHDKVWDMHFDPSSNVIDAHVARLRKKLEQAGSSAGITTRRGVGFVLAVKPSQEVLG